MRRRRAAQLRAAWERNGGLVELPAVVYFMRHVSIKENLDFSLFENAGSPQWALRAVLDGILGQ